MSKLSNMMNMLLILQNGQKYTTKELAERLEVGERMIRTYKDELEKAGIYIDTIQGKYGGYLLNDDLSEINIGLSKADLGILEQMNEYIRDKDELNLSNEFELIMKKIRNVYDKNTHHEEKQYYGNLDGEYNTEDKHNLFEKAIKEKLKLKISYVSFTSKMRTRIIHPIHRIKYKRSWFLLAFCEAKGELRQFKYDRIIKYELMKEKYDEIDVLVDKNNI